LSLILWDNFIKHNGFGWSWSLFVLISAIIHHLMKWKQKYESFSKKIIWLDLFFFCYFSRWWWNLFYSEPVVLFKSINEDFFSLSPFFTDKIIKMAFTTFSWITALIILGEYWLWTVECEFRSSKYVLWSGSDSEWGYKRGGLLAEIVDPKN
jgi:hypothetical protein